MKCMACEFYFNKAILSFFFFSCLQGNTLCAMKEEGKAPLMGPEASFADRDGATELGQVL